MPLTTANSDKPRIYSNIVADYKRVSSNPGERIDPVDGSTKVHAGVDIAVASGTPVNTPASGEVWAIGQQLGGYGNFIVVAYPNVRAPTSFAMYAHLRDEPLWEVGEAVEKGVELGLSGNTGKSTGPHLHYEERIVGPGKEVEFSGSTKNYIQFLTKAEFIDPNKNLLGFGTWDATQLDRWELTRAERFSQLRLTDSEFESFKDQLGSIETKGKSLEQSYLTISKTGEYLGRYQFGKSTGMVEAGYLDKAGNWTDYAKSRGVASEKDFLNNPTAQNDALRRLTDRNGEFLVRNDLDLYIGDAIEGNPLTGAGLLLGAHNSRGNLRAYVESLGDTNEGDGNGFAISNYVALGDKVQAVQSVSSAVASSDSATGGYWHYPTYPDEMGNPVSVPGERVWISDSLATFGNGRSIHGTPSPSVPTGTPVSPSPRITSVPSGLGEPLTFDLGNGKLIRVGDSFDGGDGRLVAFSAGSNTLVIDVKIGENLYERRTYNGSANVATQFWEYAKDQIDAGTGEAVQYFDGEVYSIGGDMYVFATGRGLVHQATGELAAAPGEISRFIQMQANGKNSSDPTNPLSVDAINGSDHQSDIYLNKIDLPLPELASLFAVNPGAFGAGQVGGFDILPFNDNSSFLTNADGDIAGEMTKLSNGWIQVKDISGNSVYVNPEAAPDDARAMLTPDQYRDAQLKDAAGALGLANSVIGLRNWDQQTDLGRLNSVVSLYNQVDRLGGDLGAGNNLPGDFGGLGAGLGFLSALESGDAGGILVNGIVLGDVVFKGAVTDAIGRAVGMSAGNVVPVLNVILALESGNPYSIVASVLYFIPVWGQIAAVIVTIFGALFGGDDEEREKPNLPMQEGEAQANWDEAGNVYTRNVQDIEGGGAGAFSWMNHLAQGLQARLAEITDEAGNPLYGLIPARLPSLGFKFDPDGMNYGDVAGHLFLKWFDDAGNEQTRYYDGKGSRGDDTGDTIVSDFMKHAQDAIVPNWEAQTMLAHWQDTRASEGLAAANAQARHAAGSGLPQEAADHLSQTLNLLSFEMPATPGAANSAATASSQQLIDIDGDGYLELTQWVAANQAMLAIDINGDGSITAGELLDLKGTSSARNNLNWLDANGDQRLDAQDPAFTALRLWIDVNQNGRSEGAGSSAEVKSLVSAGITAIDFGASPPQIIRADGSSTALSQHHLTGDVLGVAYSATDGGLLEAKELGETVLHAFNTRAFDGEVAHTHGGDVDTDGLNDSQAVLINPRDARLSTTTARTLANRTGSLGFIPLGAGSAQQAQREATAAMVRSADSSLFGVGSGATPLVALALGVGAVQWPTVASAASVGSLTSVGEDGQLAAVRAEPLVQSSGEGVEALRQAQDEWGGAQGERLDAARVDLTSLQIGQVIADIHPQGSAQDGAAGSAAAINASNQAWDQQIRAQAASNLIAELTSLSGLSGSSPDAEGEPSSALTGVWAGQDIAAVPLDYPQVNGEVIAGTEDIGLRISAALLLANDSTLNAGDPSRPLLSICAVSQPVHGQVALRINEDGATEVVFIPEANYHGQASFAYTVTDQYGLSSVATATLQISGINDAPTTGDETASGNEDATFMFAAADLLANDVDVDSAKDGDALRITRVGLAQHGMVFLDAGGQVRFVPDANYSGAAQFSYWVGDRSEADMAAANNGGVGLESPATMHLTVLPVNDLPVVTGETLASDEDVVLAINPALLLANDTDVDIASNGQTLTISAVNGAQHGAVSLLANGTIQFTPEQDYFGAASFVYTVSDGNGGYVEGTAVVNLAPVNDVPVVNNELLMGKRNATYTLSQAALLANDTDVETPNGLSIVLVQGMTHGTAVLNPNGSVTFTPTPGYAGRGSFAYVVQDADGAQATGTTEIDFAAINVNPVAVDDSFVGLEDTAFVIQPSQLLVNDSDPDASGLVTLAVDAVRNASNGTVVLQADGSVRFNPSANFSGTATFEYRLNDGEGGQTWATAQLTVQSVNDAPVIEAIWYGDPVYDYYKWVATPGYYIYPEYGPPTYVDPGPHLEQLTSPAEVQGFLNSQGYLMGPVGNVASYSLYNNGQVRPTSFSALDGTEQAYVPPVIDPDGGVGVPGYYVTVPANAILREHGKIIAYDPDGDSAAITLSVAASPQHGHLWVNAVTPNSTADVAHVGAVLVGQSGAWQYYSHVGDPYHGGDPFSIRVTDGGGASTEAVVQPSHYGTSPSGGGGGGGGGGGCFPVALDLAGNGIELIRPEDSAIFADINDDGWHERIGWTAASDGVLAFDANQDGRITRSDEVSFVGYKEGALTDLEGLAAFDTDGDGRITANDAQWARFGVLQDTNANGLQDAGELRTLNELGISAISLQREGTPHMNQGNVVFGTSAVQWADGHTTRASDVMFAGENVALPDVVGEMLAGTLAAAPAPASQEPAVPPMADESARFEQARVNQMAELFNQFVNTATTDGPALGYVGVSNSGIDTLVVAESYTGFNEGQHAATQVLSSLPGGGA